VKSDSKCIFNGPVLTSNRPFVDCNVGPCLVVKLRRRIKQLHTEIAGILQILIDHWLCPGFPSCNFFFAQLVDRHGDNGRRGTTSFPTTGGEGRGLATHAPVVSAFTWDAKRKFWRMTLPAGAQIVRDKAAMRDLAKRRRAKAAAAVPEAGTQLAARFIESVEIPGAACVSGFWPMGDEIDLRPLLSQIHARGHVVGLPVVVGRDRPLIFRAWVPGDMLVLLIVFMVTAPLLTVGVPIDLPKTKAQSIADPDEPLVVSVNAEGVIFIQDTEVPIDNLVARLSAITGTKPDTRIYVRGDQTIAYGRVMEVMGRVNSAGFTRVALIAELPKDQ